MLEIGSILDGKYKVLNEIGRGGMSVVYLVINEKVNKTWAAKEIRKDGKLDEQTVKTGLVAETEILTRLRHPNMPSIVDIIEMEDTFIFIMDYIEGNSLKKALKENGALPEENVIKWAKQLCDVLGYLHSQPKPIIYRDMKPGNIMLKPDGNVSLIDFGAAREYKEAKLEDTTSLGTLGYAAPEQIGQDRTQSDQRTDIYSLGVTLHHLVTGLAPNESCKVLFEFPPIRQINPALSDGFEYIIMKCIKTDKDERYQSVAELLYDLEHYKEIGIPYRNSLKRKFAAFLTTSILTVVFAGVSIWGYISAENKKTENFDYILANASDVQDYYDAMLTDTSRKEAYLGSADNQGLIQYLITDGELSSEEGAYLAKLKVGLDEKDSRGYITTVDVLKDLKDTNEADYQSICNEIGEAYLFYYDVGVEKDKYAAAASWFQYAQETYPSAGIYCEISNCLQNISKYAKAEQYAKLAEEYLTLWDEVVTLQSEASEYDDDLKLLVWNEIVNMIRNNAAEFCEVISTDSQLTAAGAIESAQLLILNMLDRIETESAQVTNIFLEDNIAALLDNIQVTRTKVQSVKN